METRKGVFKRLLCLFVCLSLFARKATWFIVRNASC